MVHFWYAFDRDLPGIKHRMYFKRCDFEVTSTSWPAIIELGHVMIHFETGQVFGPNFHRLASQNRLFLIKVLLEGLSWDP